MNTEHDDYSVLLHKLAHAEERIQRLREALKPFAEWNSKITDFDIARAKKALNDD
jgi:hypothetical protein